MKKLNINQKCFVWILLTTFIIFSAMNIAWALPVNERTQQVQDAIVAAVDGVNAAADVTDTHLAAITTLNLRAKEISTLKSGDFSELSSLTTLYLDNNRLTSLPADVFSGLSSLKYLYLNNNQLNNLPATLFSSLSSIEEINLHSNRLTRLPDNLFTGLTSLRQLVLHKNLLKSLDADTFSGLSSLEYLYLHNNQLTSLPANLFSKLALLKHMLLHNNQLTRLSPGMFRELSTPRLLWLQGNVVNPLSLNISVVKVNENQFKVIVPAGAPFDMNIPLTVTNGSITSGASGVTIATGAVESIPFTVAHTPDTTNAVSVDIGTLPSPPAFHFGYVLVNYTNTAPVFTEGTSATRSVAENTETGTNIGAAVVATDADDDPLTYTLSGTDAASFAIDNTTGQLKTEAALDFETENAYTVTVTVSDGYGGSDSITITINVTDIDETSPNRAPIFVEGTSITRAIAENTAADTNIGIAITATDADNDTLTYTLSGNPDAASFAIDSTTGQLKTSASLDYETKNTYKVAVTVSDGALTDIINVTINIRDANDAPVFTAGSTATRTIAENTTSDVNIGAAMTATDADGDRLTYTLGGTDAASFVIDNTNGQLKTSASLNFETENAYTVIVTASDGSLTDTITVTINVTDVDENRADPAPPNRAPIFVEGDSTTRAVAQDTEQGINIGTPVLATDADDDTLIYTLGGTDAAIFDIDSTTGQLKTKVRLDVETKPFYTVTVTASDGSLTDIITVTINLSSIDENNPPVFTEGESTTRVIAENTAAGTNIGAPITATDADDDTLTYTLSGTDAAAFAIENTTGQLKTKASLDYETESSYSVTMTVSDSDLTDVINVNINIRNANDAPIFTEGDSTTRAIAENTAAGTNIGAPITATDDDDDTLIYELLGTDVASFSIDSTNGQLKTKKNLDYETKDTYSVTILVTDRKLTDTIHVTINISSVDENNPPVFTEGESTTRAIAENTAADTNIGAAITATDADGDPLTYTLGGTDAAAFAIENTTGQLKTKALLDYETESSYSVTMTVSDGDLTDVINVNINIRNVNDAPVFIEGESATRVIAENTAAGTNIGAPITATDDDNDTLIYELLGTDVASFTINSTNGQLKTKKNLDYETKDTYSVTILVTDRKLTDTIHVTINISSVDENNPPVFTEGESTTRAIAENTAAGTNIGAAITATDADGDPLTYTLSGTDAAAFAIENTTGQLKTKASLDYETESSYSVTMTVSDSDLTDVINVNINIRNANDAPIFTEGDSTTRAIAENTAAGANIGTSVVATDADSDTLNYTLSGTDAAAFAIDNTTGQLKTKALLDYETESSYSVTMTVSDSDLTDVINVNINIRNANDAPIFTEGDSTTRAIAENTAAGANIGTSVVATDADSDTLNYTLNGTDAASFAIENTTGQLKTKALLDYETESSYSVTMTVSDGDLTDVINVNINIRDVNDAPVFIEGESATRAIAENTAADTNIGAPITATDDDDDTLIYELLGTDVASFSIDSTNGQLKTKKNLDYETKDTYSVTILVTDRKLTDTIRVTINVTDVDENRAPEFTEGDSATRAIAENTAADTNIGTAITATDVDNDTLTYTLGGTNAADFAIDSETGQLKTSAALDFETKKTYTVTVTVSDSSLTDIITVTINVRDVDENRAPVFTEGDSTTRSIAENTAADTNIGTAITATDVDNDTLTYTLGGTNAADFAIDSETGQLKTSAALDFETKKSYTVTVTVSDSSLTDIITVTINVTDVDENRAPEFTEGDTATRSVEENTAADTNIGTAITATDADNDTLTYTLSGTDAADFAIVSTTGQLKTSAALDFETDSSYAVTVTVSDGSLTDTITVTISITDVDETQPNNPPEFTEGDTAYRTVPQTSPDGDNIGAPISATDADGDTLTYTTTSTRFAIDSTSGQLLKKDGIEYVIDIEGKDYSTDITVTVSDGRGGSDSIQVLITLTYVYRLGCWRSTEVKAAIVAAAGVESWDEVTEAHLTAITSLDLSNLSNSFYDIYKGFANQFCGLTSLTHLDLSNNNIDGYFGIEEGTFEGEGLSSLTHLDLSYNKINKIDDNAFKGLSSLTHLDLSSNRKYNSYNSVELSEDSLAGLSSLTHLYLNRCGISSLPSDVFDGLSALTELSLSSNSITSLPSDVFDGLSALTELSLSSNSITSLPSDVFDGLSALTELSLSSNSITSLPSDVFDGLSALTELYLHSNSITSLPSEVFDGLSALTILGLRSNSITSLSSEVFDGLSALTELILHSNGITSLPSDVFDGLSALTRLYLHSNSLTSLPSDVFDGLSALTELSLSSNSITSLSSDVFDGLSALTKLYLNNNQLNELPDGIFEGVSSLSVLLLQNNAVDPLPINVSLEKVGTNQVKAVAPTGVPFDIVVPLTVANGSISGATSVTISIGKVESGTLTVTRTSGTTGAVTVDIGTLPSIPSSHSGYSLVKSTDLPLEVIGAVGGAPTTANNSSPQMPEVTALLANYPNPSNPETWIPYQLAKSADVSLTIYNVRGVVVRKLTLGHQQAGIYHSRSRAAHWDGKNEIGESVASGVYFYMFKAGKYTALRKMLIRK